MRLAPNLVRCANGEVVSSNIALGTDDPQW